ncbi:MAG TPA: dienelactone hydrolase family protein [Longimicrobium sp.]|nr:dienelactone hydrolase family protein [Longimicrobium sp.]
MPRIGGSFDVRIPAPPVMLDATVTLPARPAGVVLFAHGSGSSRFSPRNRYVAGELEEAGFVTVLLDLLTPEEEAADRRGGRLRFDIPLLAERLVHAVDWLRDAPRTRHLPLGCFGASTGAAAALVAAASRPDAVQAVVSRGGRPDLAGDALERVHAPTLLVVGGLDAPVIAANEGALRRMRQAEVRLCVVEGATHLFEEPDALEEVADLARAWFRVKLVGHALAGAGASGPDGDGPEPPFRQRGERW